ncbi:MAG: serine/threonine protein kinase [Deltaproteobacteria bacterium]|nr:serine/threonine protein kinase [Deltaproteobacteria bacterium]
MSGIPAGAGSLLNKRLGKYEILALLALGGTAEIYLARIGGAAGFEKYVVVKCLHDHLNDDQDFVKMFLDEARLAAHLDHSNIVQTMELGEQDGRYYMVMEFLAGLSMAMMVRRVAERLPGGIPVSLTLNMLAQSCAGLHYAHEKTHNGKPLNIVHRDISPQNLVVSFEGVVKVVDFGIAKAEHRETRTRSGTIKGKFAYMSPEQCVAHNVDRRTDIFALGVIAHELLTGRRLFKRTSPYETYQAVIDCAVPTPSSVNIHIDPTLDPLIMRALAKDKEERYPTAEAFGDAILGYLHHRGKGSGPGDVSRFFDASFTQEIEEHGARMRELISGRDIAVDSAKWDEDEEKRRNETVDLGARSSAMELQTGDLMRPSAASLSDVLSGMNVGNTTGDRPEEDEVDEDDMPADRTRIESNPLELLADLDKAPVPARTGKTPAPVVIPKAQAETLRPLAPRQPNPQPIPSIRPLQAKMPPSGPLPLPAPPPGPQSSGPTPRASGKFPELANLPTMIADLDEASESGEQPGLAETQLRTDDVLASEATGAPRVGAESATQAAIPFPQPARAAFESGTPSYSHAHARTQPQPVQPEPPAQQPYTLNPNYMQPAPGSGGYGAPNPALMSPVGQQYPQGVDWETAASAPARAVPGWMLGIIFAGAIGLALVLTIIIAKIAT